MLPEQQQRIMGYFIEEAKDHLNTIEQGLLNLQDTIEDPELVNEVFRAAHSVKGGAAMLGLSSVQQTAHRLEDSFKILKECKVQVDQQLESLFLRVFDTLKALLEQLSNPFGLTEEVADKMLRDVEPVFEALNNHLEELVKHGGVLPVESQMSVASQGVRLSVVANDSQNARSSRPASVAQTAAATEESALQLIFRSDVTSQLREMLQLFKQPESSESRQQLDQISHSLKTAGEQFELPNWTELIEAVQKAIACPDNSYRTLAPIIIKEIKQAQELVLEGRSAEITVSSALEALLPPELVPEEELEDLLTFAEVKASQTELDSDLDLPLLDFESEDNSLPLWDTSESTEVVPASKAQTDEWLDETTALWDGMEWAETTNADGQLQFEDPGDLAGTGDRTEYVSRRADHTGPEVGMAELNSLADLFEEIPDLDGSWEQEENSDFTAGTSALNQPILDDDEDSSGDFTDLLFDGEGSPKLPTAPTPGTDDLASLFGEEFLLGDDNSSSSKLMGEDSWAQTDLSPIASTLDESNLDDETFLSELTAETEATPPPSNSEDLASLFGEFNETDFLDLGPEASPDGSASATLSESFADGLGVELEASPLFPDFPDELEASDSQEAAGNLSALDDLLAISESSEAEDDQPAVSLDFPDELEASDSQEAAGNLSALDDLLGLELSEVDDDRPAASLDFSDELEASDSQEAAGNLSALDDLLGLELSETEDDQPAASLDFPDELEASDSQEAAGNLSALDDLLGLELSETEDDQQQINHDRSASSETFLEDNWENTLDLDGFDNSLTEQPENGDLESLFGDLTSMADTSQDITTAPSAAVPVAADSESDFEELFGLETADDAASANDWLELEASNDSEALPDFDLEWGDTEAEEIAAVEEQPDLAVAESIPSATSSFELLDELLDEVALEPVAEALPVAEQQGFDDLLEASDAAAMLSESVESAEPDLDFLALTSDFASLEEADNAALELEAVEGDFEDLEAMLEEAESAELVTTPAIAPSSVDVFSELEGLLSLEEEATPSPQPATPPATTSAAADEFADLDSLLDQIQPTARSEAAIAPTGRPTARPSRSSRIDPTMRVPVKQMDNLSNLMGELVVNRNSLEQDQERMRQFLDNLLHQVTLLSDVGQRMQDLYERSLLEISLLASRQGHRTSWRTEEPPSEGHNSNRFGLSDIELDRFTPFHTLSQEIIELIVRVRESAADIEFLVDEADQVTRQLRQVTTQLQEGLTRARMMPFSHTTDRLPRAVRDISIKCGKQAQLVVEGKDILIDKMILEQLFDPMTHLVNNAITHGIEPPEVRQAAGKAPMGRITIRAFHQGNQTVIAVSDDGAGIDPQKVKAKAIKQGLITPSGAQKMSRAEVYDLLFMPGFSTQEQATEFAGRGVGMDVVRTNLSDIRGSISIDSTVGKGTVFTIRLPLILSISKALCCISDRARIAFPMDGVEDMIDVPREQVQTGADGQQYIEWRGSMLPFRHLRELLKYNRYLGRASIYGSNLEDDMISVIVLRSAGNFLAVQVDQVSTEQEIVIKQLEGPVPKPLGIAGATVLGDGRIVAIADVLELIDLATGRLQRDAGGMLWDESKDREPIEVHEEATEPTVLIVDDSITVRELLSMTFLKAGYRVEQARDGKEAWEKLKSGLPCEIVFCDIEMPKMDGLELLSRMQKDPTLSELPIAMLTSRGADRHRQMAYSLGARGYFTKPYLEEQLLDAASRMIKGEVVGAPSGTTA
ncbi:MAG: response regulator [Actinomycetota bacterium]